MTVRLPNGLIRGLHAGNTAIFLDFDGTLVEIADRPHLVRLEADTHRILSELQAAVDGALAIVTGRTLSDLDSFLTPLKAPVAAIHGLVRRSADGALHESPIDKTKVDELESRLRTFANDFPELLVERKPVSVALHYRQRPALEARCLAFMNEVTEKISGLVLLRGKMVIEIKAGTENKGDAIRKFMEELPFAGRIPLFAGDDVTDEDAFAEVNVSEGISIKVGSGATAARYRTENVKTLGEWLGKLVQRFSGAGRP